MPKTKTRNVRALLVVQAQAQAWITKKLSTEVFPLPTGMTEEEFERAMNAVVRWTMEAYIAGANV